ncbi:MAG: hypothetical protein ABL962_16890, partial [Fimbriimonadaceae bacterium]
AESNTMTRWRYFTGTSEGKPCIIDGVDIWQQPWFRLPLTADVEDARSHKSRENSVFAVDGGTRAIYFVSTEMSNGCYAIYVPYLPTQRKVMVDPRILGDDPDYRDERGMKIHAYDLPDCSFSDLPSMFPHS